MSELKATDKKHTESEWPVYFANGWQDADRFAVAVLILISIERQGKGDSEWVSRFQESVFHHFAIVETAEQQAILDVVLREKEENNIFVFETIASSLIPGSQIPCEPKKDIRKEVLSDFLMICLGLFDTHENSEDTEKSTKNSHNKHENKVGEYDARSRSAIFSTAKLLHLPVEDVHSTERRVSQELYFIKLSEQELENTMDETTKNTIASHSNKNKKWRWIATGVSAVVGATAIGLTGGLAAPFVAAGISALGLGSAAFLASTAGVAVITSLFGIAGGGLAGFKVTKRMRNLREFYFKPITIADPTLPAIPSLNATIVVSGYLRTLDDATFPWKQAFSNAQSHRDIYSLVFESDELLALGSAFDVFLATEAAKFAATETLKRTVMASLIASVALPISLLKAGDLIDNPWILGIDRAKKAGLVLADVLIERIQGNRPASLIGFSLGALTIFECLLELSRRKKYGLIDEVILLGAPISIDNKRWTDACSVVSRRFINGYSTKDWVLGFLFRIHNLNLNAAGLEPVNISGVESIDLTELVNGHNGYLDNLGEILRNVRIDM